MTWLDWIIVIVPTLLVTAVTLYARRFVRDVADFLAAGRSARRYLVSVSDGMAAMGLITAVGAFEMFYNSGLAIGWWGQLGIPITTAIALLGFVIYRYRQTRALTMAHFFEMRYSRSLRVFMGVLAFVSGVVNYGIFPIVGARFVVHYVGLPMHVMVGPVPISTYAVLCALFLGVALLLVLRGGQLQILITDCLQGLVCGVLFLVVAGAILLIFSQKQMFEAMSARPDGMSLINPFDTEKMADFNIAYVLISLFSMVYTYMSWQGNQGFNASALNAHEAKMGKILAGWRGFAVAVMFTLIGIGAITFMHHQDFAPQASGTYGQLGAIASSGGEQIGKQLAVPLAVRGFLPDGVRGCFLVIMLFLMVSTDTSYLHSWGSIFVQDVVLPFKRKPLSKEAHLRLLRIAIVGVAAFAFVFGLVFPQTEYVFMFFNITGAIYLGGSGAVIIGGLYWSRGTTAGAWAAMLVGSGLAVAGIVLPIVIDDFPLNGTWMMLIAMTAGIGSYVIVSLATCRTPFEMDKLLHQGAYEVKEDVVAVRAPAAKIPRWQQVLWGVDEHFTRGDKTLAGVLFGWSMMMFAAFIIVSLINQVWPWSDRAWWRWWQVNSIVLPMFIGVVTTVWFTIFGLRDLLHLFRHLKARAPLETPSVLPQPIDATAAAVDPLQALEPTTTDDRRQPARA